MTFFSTDFRRRGQAVNGPSTGGEVVARISKEQGWEARSRTGQRAHSERVSNFPSAVLPGDKFPGVV